MQAITDIIVQYLPTILTTIVTTIVAIISKQLSANSSNLQGEVKKSITTIKTYSDRRLDEVETLLVAMAKENNELKAKLNKTLEALTKVEVRDENKEA